MASKAGNLPSISQAADPKLNKDTKSNTATSTTSNTTVVASSSSRPRGNVVGAELSTAAPDSAVESSSKKKPRHRAGKKRRKRRESFAAADDDDAVGAGRGNGGVRGAGGVRPGLETMPERVSEEARDSFYRLGRGQGSATSLESEALLDHRDHGPLQARRQSIHQGGLSGRHNSNTQSRSHSHRQPQSPLYPPSTGQAAHSRSRLNRVQQPSDDEDEDEDSHDRAPLLGSSHRTHSNRDVFGGYGGLSESPAGLRRDPFFAHQRRQSTSSSKSGRKKNDYARARSEDKIDEYDVNNPPSVPSSPKFGPEMGYGDVMLTDADIHRGRSPEQAASREVLIDIDDDGNDAKVSPKNSGVLRRMTLNPVDDVCFPQDQMTELGDEDDRTENYTRRRRGRAKIWPDLSILEEWSHEEKEQRTIQGIRARKVSEPLMVGGRLRPQKTTWHRDEEEQPLRFTYFNEDFTSTLHSQSLSELIQEGQSFRELFIPDAPVLSDSESEPEDDFAPQLGPRGNENGSVRRGVLSPQPQADARNSSRAGNNSRHTSQTGSTRKGNSNEASTANTGRNTPSQEQPSTPTQPSHRKSSSPRYGTRPIWWLDVLSPTDAEMKVLSKAFSIHPLTAEDIMMQEQREKVELFRNYYFVNYRTFEQDATSEDYMEPINMYVVIFKEGVLSFHFSQTPHPANVRRRIRQLTDYLILTTDWISYAIIDDITDAYAPLAERIEEEVDDIDESILGMHTDKEQGAKRDKSSRTVEFGMGSVEKVSDDGKSVEWNATVEAGDMLRRVGECRKKVMSLYRLLGNKADVIKGFAKRCNEQWDIAPKSEIGLYLGDIQDHIVTMTGNLSHYENLLSRAHSNYLAQINIRMNERAEKTNDVLSNLTVLGTIVLPMNIITGMWGMNCLVPGQSTDNLYWFWGITAGLLLFGITCFFIAKRTYGIV
ncbi:cora-domain-containing protein [Tothia fuscella]|uniref:Cora-domain-containing protein n=1 Tax=Tothia fuscella TaxID=1048955 RepID=A0A9P4NEU0_9PEZI|nr:cora-domain-containing protein [Tothia fuscella]